MQGQSRDFIFFFKITFLFEVGMQALLSSPSPPPLSVLQPMKRMGPVATPLGTFMCFIQSNLTVTCQLWCGKERLTFQAAPCLKSHSLREGEILKKPQGGENLEEASICLLLWDTRSVTDCEARLTFFSILIPWPNPDIILRIQATFAIPAFSFPVKMKVTFMGFCRAPGASLCMLAKQL